MAECIIAVDFIFGPMNEYWLFHVIAFVIFDFYVFLSNARDLESMAIIALPQE
jgi:hypothetical protein